METPDGIRDLQSIAVPLLLNLESPAFEEAMSILQPQKIRERLHRLREQIEAGSPRPQFELAFDPLGLIAPALKPFAESNALEEEQPLTSPDRTMRVFLVVTNQPSLSAFECQRLMRTVNAFRAPALAGPRRPGATSAAVDAAVWDGVFTSPFLPRRACAWVVDVRTPEHDGSCFFRDPGRPRG